MGALVELEDRHPVLEMMARDQTRRLELRQNAVNGGEPDVLVRIEEGAVDVFGRKMACGGAALENLENFQPRQRHLQTGFTKVLAFHGGLSSEQHAGRGCGMSRSGII